MVNTFLSYLNKFWMIYLIEKIFEQKFIYWNRLTDQSDDLLCHLKIIIDFKQIMTYNRKKINMPEVILRQEFGIFIKIN